MSFDEPTNSTKLENRSPTFLLVAGEASSDLHGAQLTLGIRHRCPDARILAIGGPRLRVAGAEILYDNSRFAVLGFVEVLRHIPFMRRVLSHLGRLLKDDPPDLVIPIDYPGFNLRLASIAHNRGIPVMYYISPQVWAWGAGRIRSIAKTVDRMVTILPFESEVYRAAGIDVSFVGHPLLDIVKSVLSREEFEQRLGISPDRKLVGLLPGSREQEVRRILPTMLGAARGMAEARKDLSFVVGRADGLPKGLVDDAVAASAVDARVARGLTYDVMKWSEILLVASGTATLESAIMGTPMVVVYRVAPLSYAMGRALIRIPNIGLVNVVAGRRIVPECVQGDAAPRRVASEALRMLEDPERLRTIREELRGVREALGEKGGAQRAADIALEMAGAFPGDAGR